MGVFQQPADNQVRASYWGSSGANEQIDAPRPSQLARCEKALKIPDCVRLVPLPPHSPELNSAERVWLYLKERYLSHRLLDGHGALVEATSEARRRF